jgi:glycine/D-amino acid oxidase-like deaminating enzyme
MKVYDYVIIGGGVGGLYVAYQILKRDKHCSLILLEKQGHLGGRVFTFHDDVMNVEAGAGRIQSGQRRIMGLLDDLELSDRLSPISSESVYVEADGTDKRKMLSMDYEKGSLPDCKGASKLPCFALEPPETWTKLVKRILESIHRLNAHEMEGLRNQTILEYVSEAGIFSKEEVQHLKDSFGYYSELVLMNAYDCVQTFRVIYMSKKFYGLRGGLSSIVDGLARRIRRMGGGRIETGAGVLRILKEDLDRGETRFCVEVSGDRTFYGAKCICALTGPALSRLVRESDLGVGRPEMTLFRKCINSVECAPLCRIYCQFDPDPETGRVWFAGMPKLTTNNKIRMIIPIDESVGVIMLSYTDYIYANYWVGLHKGSGVGAVNRMLRKLVAESLGFSIPAPKNTKLFYWDCGVGYWGVGVNSREVSRKMVQPFARVPFYTCGENFSERGQQWIEGALDTADMVLRKL